jgi:hypothetical protein
MANRIISINRGYPGYEREVRLFAVYPHKNLDYAGQR